MMMRSLIVASLVLGSAARLARRDFSESPLDVKSADPADVQYALQDLQDAMQIKGQFNNFLDRVNSDADKLHAALENQASKVSDLELEKQSLQNQMQNEKARLSHELEVFKQKMIAKITDLKTTNRRLEETNMQLVASNDKLNSELEAEKGKKEILVKKLKKMAGMFDKQQKSVQTIIQQNSQRIESEVNSDVSEALNTANDALDESVAMPKPTYNAPFRAPAASAASEDEEDAMKLPPGLDDEEDDEAPVPQRQSTAPKVQVQPVQQVVAPQPKAAPHVGEIKKAVSAAANSAAAQARKAVEAAARKARARADARVDAEQNSNHQPASVAAPKAVAPVAQAAPKIAPKVSSADDEQLKALRNEVESLEASVKTDDAEAPSASMLHVNKKTNKVIAQDKSGEGSDSVKTLQDVGGMLSAAMEAGDGDDDN